ncbi:metal-dependent transcriptional regulator [Thermosphaera aggregans]|uniref:Iron (Metal) dependent repressor, DtxR family n=1 Tax=Thermosphaera aggregans (strain DSM 11486 / M11TL) TaxID=633148 RepID=D5U0X0_THEAM|nr:metal-dependent transcriptional regulator [Thermosphaera aggregans]ADG90770.1 iron (metal) dependent repressor, DtxR family [Thermosphaera aggregans DSM 11486]
MAASIREEEYVEVIYELQECGNLKIREIARRLGVKPSSVVEFLRKLEEKGLLEYKKGGKVQLTSKGLEVAKSLEAKHQLLYRFLTALGVPKEIAIRDACKMEHYLHPETIARIKEFLSKCNMVELK